MYHKHHCKAQCQTTENFVLFSHSCAHVETFKAKPRRGQDGTGWCVVGIPAAGVWIGSWRWLEGGATSSSAGTLCRNTEHSQLDHIHLLDLPIVNAIEEPATHSWVGGNPSGADPKMKLSLRRSPLSNSGCHDQPSRHLVQFQSRSIYDSTSTCYKSTLDCSTAHRVRTQ